MNSTKSHTNFRCWMNWIDIGGMGNGQEHYNTDWTESQWVTRTCTLFAYNINRKVAPLALHSHPFANGTPTSDKRAVCICLMAIRPLSFVLPFAPSHRTHGRCGCVLLRCTVVCETRAACGSGIYCMCARPSFTVHFNFKYKNVMVFVLLAFVTTDTDPFTSLLFFFCATFGQLKYNIDDSEGWLLLFVCHWLHLLIHKDFWIDSGKTLWCCVFIFFLSGMFSLWMQSGGESGIGFDGLAVIEKWIDCNLIDLNLKLKISVTASIGYYIT